MSELRKNYPIRRGKSVRGVFVEAPLFDLSLEATGLAVHVLARESDLFDESALRAQFPDRDISGPLEELRAVGLIEFLADMPTQETECAEKVPTKVSPLCAGTVYLIESAGRFKIGITRQIGARLHSLQTGSPFPMRLVESRFVPDCARAEALAHALLDKYRLHGEWFKCTEQEALAALLNAAKAVTP